MRKPIILLLVGLLLLLCSSCSYHSSSEPSQSVNLVPSETILPSTSMPQPTQKASGYYSDALILVEKIEEVHPIFVIGEKPENYDTIKAQYLETALKPITKTEFLLATQKYLKVLSDGHMGGGLLDSGKYIDIKWISVDNHLYLLDEEGKQTKEEVVEIGGVPIKTVLQQIDTYYFAENDTARQRQYEAYCRQKEMLDAAKCTYEDDSLTLTISVSGVEKSLTCKFITSSRFLIYYGNNPRYIINHKMIDDVFYVGLGEFRPGKSVGDTAEAIRDAVDKGTTKFIIDIRNNSGGDSKVGAELLSAMGMAPPSYGGYIRNSELSKKQRGTSGKKKVEYFPPNLNTARNNTKIRLVVLTDRNTFSSATMLGVWVQDGKLGKIIGQPSSNAPTSFGDLLSVYLPECNSNLQVSYKKFLRPDSDADQKTLQPDILTQQGEDALNAALDYLDTR